MVDGKIMEETFGSSNIHLSWLENILEQLKSIQNMERMMREGCQSLIDFVQIPRELRHIIIPEAQYKNLRFITMELDILISNLPPILNKDKKKDKLEDYKKSIKKILNIVYDKKLFLKQDLINNSKVIIILPFFDKTVDMILEIKSNLLKDIAPLLYLEEQSIKKW